MSVRLFRIVERFGVSRPRDDKPGANMAFRVEWPNVVREQKLYTRLQKYVPGKYKYDPFMLRTCTANKSCSLEGLGRVRVVIENVSPGLKLDLPCRVLGRYQR